MDKALAAAQTDAVFDRKAREILVHLKTFEERGPYSAQRGEIQIEHSKAIELLRACRAAGVPPSEGLIELIAHCIDNPPSLVAMFLEKRYGVGNGNAKKFYECVALEREKKAQGATASTRWLAREVGAARSTVQRWRERPAYQRLIAGPR